MTPTRKSKSLAARLQATPDTPPDTYRCSNCGIADAWSDGWHWFGSWVTGPKRILCPECSRGEVHEVLPV